MFVRWASVVLRDLFIVAVIFTVLAGGGPVSRKAPTPLAHAQPRSLIYEDYIANKRVEAVARAICLARGVNPDHVGAPFPEGPIWEFFIPDAVLFLAEYDAASGKE
jgi:hypothetical protein